MAKITLATIKSFVKKNKDKLYIRTASKFDGMYDCVMDLDGGFEKIVPSDRDERYTLGIAGCWIVRGGSRNWFRFFDNGEFAGYECSNCCGNFYLAIRKEAA